MSKTILQMFISSRNKFIYLFILVIPSILIVITIHNNVLNFTVLLLVNFIATFTSLILSLEILIQEEGTKVYSYLKTLRSENFLMMYRTASIFAISSVLTLFTWFMLNGIYAKDINIIQQTIYLILILFGNFFYIYFLQYLFVNIKNALLRNSILTGVTAISMLSLMTRDLATYTTYVTIIGLFLAVTFMNRRLTEELKREAHDKIQ